jgi:hypothetical protein
MFLLGLADAIPCIKSSSCSNSEFCCKDSLNYNVSGTCSSRNNPCPYGTTDDKCLSKAHCSFGRDCIYPIQYQQIGLCACSRSSDCERPESICFITPPPSSSPLDPTYRGMCDSSDNTNYKSFDGSCTKNEQCDSGVCMEQECRCRSVSDCRTGKICCKHPSGTLGICTGNVCQASLGSIDNVCKFDQHCSNGKNCNLTEGAAYGNCTCKKKEQCPSDELCCKVDGSDVGQCKKICVGKSFDKSCLNNLDCEHYESCSALFGGFYCVNTTYTLSPSSYAPSSPSPYPSQDIESQENIANTISISLGVAAGILIVALIISMYLNVKVKRIHQHHQASTAAPITVSSIQMHNSDITHPSPEKVYEVYNEPAKLNQSLHQENVKMKNLEIESKRHEDQIALAREEEITKRLDLAMRYFEKTGKWPSWAPQSE